MRRTLLLAAAAAAIFLLWGKWHDRQPAVASAPVILKQPLRFTSHSFDPLRPPAEMPPLQVGEEAECVANFTSRANVAGQMIPEGALQATVIVTQVQMTLGLEVVIWVPIGATQHVVDHEEGHRQIAEKYYENAGPAAERVAARYLGRRIRISGADLHFEFDAALQKISSEINDEYNRELDSGPAQLRYDSITDHARNDVPATSAVAQALAFNPPH